MTDTIRVYVSDPRYAPTRAHPTDAGLDLKAAGEYLIPIGRTALIDTKAHFEIPTGYFGQLSLRSSLMERELIMPIGYGIIDCDYRGSIKIPLKNDGTRLQMIYGGERLAQLILIPCITPEVEIVAELSELSATTRGTGGFGSTGI